MISKIKEIFLLIFLILLQSCSGGRIGDFLESSFENSERIEKSEETTNLIGEQKNIDKKKKEEKEKEIFKNKKVFNSDNEKKIPKTVQKEKEREILKSKKVLNSEKQLDKTVQKEREILKSKKVLNSEKKLDKTKKVNNLRSSQRKRKNELQSYRIIFILKEVDPRDPIGELSNALKNAKVNFEIEKIERFLNLKKINKTN